MSNKTLIAIFTFAYALGFVEYWHWAMWYAPQIGDLYAYQKDLLQGHAPWLADQNRVLAPLIIEAIRRVLGSSYDVAYQHFIFWSFIALNSLSVVLFHQCRLTASQAVTGLLLVAAVPMLLYNHWWFPWTNLEAVLFLLAFIVDAAKWRPALRGTALAGIFVAMVLTKETAIFLPIWLFLRRAAFWPHHWVRFTPWAGFYGAMTLVSLAVDAELRRRLWVSGTIPNLPDGLPPHGLPHMFGTHLLILDYPQLTFGYYVQNLSALIRFRPMWPIFNNGAWTDWPAGAVAFFVALGLSGPGAIWSFRRREPALLALALFVLAYLCVLFVCNNMPESDKLMPVLIAGLYAYALLARTELPVKLPHGDDAFCLSPAKVSW